jgi:hypothetical protein
MDGAVPRRVLLSGVRNMSWAYRQRDGELLHNGEFVGTGYSGRGEGRNNPDMEAVPNVGPIPRGRYRIGGARFSQSLGPIVMDLEPVAHDAHGRSLFRIHGDNANHDASHGCIILGPLIRRAIADSGDKTLEVV